MIEKIIKDFIDKFILEFKKEENQKKLEFEILNPILTHYTNKIYPYISLLMFLYFINLVLIVLILFLIIMFNRKNKILN
jgi:hypothetical protein